MLQKAFKDECMGKTQIKEWYGRFKNGRTSVDSDPRSGRPSTGTSSHNVERVRAAVEQDRRLTVRELEDEIRIPKSIVWRILTENLGMTRVCAKFIPKLLSDQQKNLRVKNNFNSKILRAASTRCLALEEEIQSRASQLK
ncbi:protein GVQW3 [Trichonephila clavipes]|nr:protein GVQW3 [Trichonephila clavipes]